MNYSLKSYKYRYDKEFDVIKEKIVIGDYKMLFINIWLHTKSVEWICINFDMSTGDTLIRDFERETRTYLDAEE